MSSVAERLRAYFVDHGVAYRVIEHQPAATAEEYHAVLGTRYEQMPKAVFFRYQVAAGERFAILALQAHKRADLEQVAKLLDAHEVRLGSREQLREATGCEFGELPPVGGLFGLPLLFDQDLLAEDELFFNAGSLTSSMAVSPKALEALERPIRYRADGRRRLVDRLEGARRAIMGGRR
jgi:Ala-tRNA(Pro) deacylase